MKKIILIAIFAIMTAIVVTMTGCNGCTMVAKNLESNYSELHRDVTVISAFTGDTIFSYSGPCYFSTPGYTANEVSLIYYVNGKSRKADFVGGGYIFMAIEK